MWDNKQATCLLNNIRQMAATAVRHCHLFKRTTSPFFVQNRSGCQGCIMFVSERRTRDMETYHHGIWLPNRATPDQQGELSWRLWPWKTGGKRAKETKTINTP